jgi:hypothetical protein
VTYDKRIPVALTSEEVAAMDVAAKAAGLTRSAWIRTNLRKLLGLTVVLLLAVGCDEYVEQDSPPMPSAVRLDTAAPVVHPWPTASDAVTAECSALCRWEVRCAGAELGACEADCYHTLCDGVNCEAPPSGSDDVLEKCVEWLHVESDSYAACAAETPNTYSDACVAAVRPAACADTPTSGSPDL